MPINVESGISQNQSTRPGNNNFQQPIQAKVAPQLRPENVITKEEKLEVIVSENKADKSPKSPKRDHFESVSNLSRQNLIIYAL